MSLNMLMWLTMLVGFAAILCLATTAYLALNMVLVPVLAALFTGLGLLLLCLCMALLIWLLTRPRRSGNGANTTNASSSPAPTRTGSRTKTAATAARSGSEQARQASHADSHEMQWLEDNYGIALAATVAAGVVVASNRRLRHFVVRSAGRAATRMASRAIRQLID